MNAYIGTVNAGFQILLAIPVGKWVYVLGHSETNPVMPWVTWLSAAPGSFGLGHYIPEERAAYRDLYRRVAEEAQALYG